METNTSRRFIIAVPPSETAGIGNALRCAYPEPQPGAWDQAITVLIEKLDAIRLTNRRSD